MLFKRQRAATAVKDESLPGHIEDAIKDEIFERLEQLRTNKNTDDINKIRFMISNLS